MRSGYIHKTPLNEKLKPILAEFRDPGSSHVSIAVTDDEALRQNAMTELKLLLNRWYRIFDFDYSSADQTNLQHYCLSLPYTGPACVFATGLDKLKRLNPERYSGELNLLDKHRKKLHRSNPSVVFWITSEIEEDVRQLASDFATISTVNVTLDSPDEDFELKPQPDRPDRDCDVYLSCTVDDAKWSEALAERLDGEGLCVHMCEWEQRPSHHLRSWLREVFPQRSKLVAVWSQRYFRDDYVQTIVEELLNNHSDLLKSERPFIPVLIDEWEMPANWSGLRGIDFRIREDFELRLRQLVQALEKSRSYRRVKKAGHLRKSEALAVKGYEHNKIGGGEFVENVAEIHEAYGYVVHCEQKISGVAAEFSITKREGGSDNPRTVVCLESRPTVPEIERIIKQVARARKEGGTHEWILVTSHQLIGEVSHSLKQAGIQHVDYPRLLKDLVPLDRYTESLIGEYEEWRARHWRSEDWFIRPDVFSDDMESREPALAQIGRWLRDESEDLLMVLGDAGSGKSTMVKFLAYHLARNFREDSLRHHVPILIPLGEVRKDISLQSIILEHLEQNQVSPSDFRKFACLARLGKVVLLFDAFDEMADHVRHDVVQNNLAELVGSARLGCKVLITCRTNYFKDYQEQTSIINTSQDKAKEYTEPIHISNRQRNIKVIYLTELSDVQVLGYLAKARPKTVVADWQKIEAVYNLKGLAHHPLLLDMILRSFSALSSGQSINAANLYTVYTNRWVEREEDKKRLLPKQFRLKLMTELALHMWNNGKETVHYQELSSFVKNLADDPESKIKAIDVLDVIREIQTASFLKRESASTGDKFSFAHPSFREYFLARKLHNTLIRPECHDAVKRLLHTNLFSQNVVRFLTMLDEDDNISRYLKLLLSDNYSALVTENALQLLYWSIRFRCGMGEKVTDPSGLRERLAAYLPSAIKMPGATMQKMVLEAADLREADFHKADLKNARFDHAVLDKANFRHADLEGASFFGADLTLSDFTGAKNLNSADFTGAILRGVKGIKSVS